MSDDTRKLIEEARGNTNGYSESELRWLSRRLADALEASLPTEDDERVASDIAQAVREERYGQAPGVIAHAVADALLQAGFRRSPVPPETDAGISWASTQGSGVYIHGPLGEAMKGPQPTTGSTVAPVPPEGDLLARLKAILTPNPTGDGSDSLAVERDYMDRAQAADDAWAVLAAVPPVISPTRHQIAEQVRRHCTPSVEAYEAGGDRLIAAVADWIENPPEWVPPVTEEPEWEWKYARQIGPDSFVPSTAEEATHRGKHYFEHSTRWVPVPEGDER